jgi:hypothetical protein
MNLCPTWTHTHAEPQLSVRLNDTSSDNETCLYERRPSYQNDVKDLEK